MEIHGGRKPTFLLEMQNTAQFEQLERLSAGVVEAAGLEMVQLELKGAGAGRLLRVLVDQPAGVGLAECERVSRALSAALDAQEAAGKQVLSGPYTLEVSSPGLDRPLMKAADFERFRGQRVQVRTRQAIGNCRSFTGRLEASGDGGVQVRLETAGTEPVTIPWANVAQARLAPVWPQTGAQRPH